MTQFTVICKLNIRGITQLKDWALSFRDLQNDKEWDKKAQIFKKMEFFLMDKEK